MTDARFWIEELDLEPHPEGGWFREVYRAKESVPAARFPGQKAVIARLTRA
jgi:predicted cupin superfamily sugar epimerase